MMVVFLLMAALPGFADYSKKHSLECVGPFMPQAQPDSLTLAGKPYVLSGSKLSVQKKDDDDEVRFGVMSSTKDWAEDTQKNVAEFVAWFESEKIEWLVLNGDIAADEEELEDLLAFLGAKNIPMLVSIGNYESRGSYFRAVTAATQRFSHIIDQNFVRVVEADDVTIFSMPGYHDRKFLHTGSGCLYQPADVTKLLDLVERTSAPKLLISHGPPKGVGAKSIDVIADGLKNVGDPSLSKLLKAGSIDFGIFGHILESGGRAVGADLATPIKEETFAPKLYVNVGGANALPWGLLDGTTINGSATVVTIKGGKAKFKHKTIRAP